MKTVAAVAGASAEFSQGVLVGDIDPQTRWSLGSLLAGILSLSANPLLLTIRDTAQGHWGVKAFSAEVPGAMGGNFGSQVAAIVFARGEGTSKSRPIQFVDPLVVVTPAAIEISGFPADPTSPLDSLISGLVAYPIDPPSFTLLGAMNRFEAYLESLAPGWLLTIDQATEQVMLFTDRAAVGVAGILATLDAAAAVASFDLTIDVTTETVPGFGWE